MASGRMEVLQEGHVERELREKEERRGFRDSLPVTFHVGANNSMRSLRRHMTLKAYTL